MSNPLYQSQTPVQGAKNTSSALTDRERLLLHRLLGYPLDLPGEFITWMEDRMRLLVTAGNVLGLSQRVATVGEYKVVATDLSAFATLHTYDDSQGRWLYCNGATFVAGDYPELEAFLGSTTLPDLRGQLKWSTTVVTDTVVGSVLIKA